MSGGVCELGNPTNVADILAILTTLSASAKREEVRHGTQEVPRSARMLDTRVAPWPAPSSTPWPPSSTPSAGDAPKELVLGPSDRGALLELLLVMVLISAMVPRGISGGAVDVDSSGGCGCGVGAGGAG